MYVERVFSYTFLGLPRRRRWQRPSVGQDRTGETPFGNDVDARGGQGGCANVSFFLNLYVLPTYGGPASILFTTMRRKRNSSSRCHGSVTRPKDSISQFPRISLTKPSKQRKMPLRRSNKCIFGIVMYFSLKLHAMKTNIKLVLNYTICSNSRA